MGKIFKSLRTLKKGHLVEVTPAGLIGSVNGQTEANTLKADSTVTTAGQEWTNGLNSSLALKLGFTRNLEFMVF
jgi:hypothetical protein